MIILEYHWNVDGLISMKHNIEYMIGHNVEFVVINNQDISLKEISRKVEDILYSDTSEISNDRISKLLSSYFVPVKDEFNSLVSK